jgi:hypothetical protein
MVKPTKTAIKQELRKIIVLLHITGSIARVQLRCAAASLHRIKPRKKGGARLSA